jgi:hypothetical protein
MYQLHDQVPERKTSPTPCPLKSDLRVDPRRLRAIIAANISLKVSPVYEGHVAIVHVGDQVTAYRITMDNLQKMCRALLDESTLKAAVQIFFSRATIPNRVLLFSNLSLGTDFLSSTVTVRARAKHLNEDSDSMYRALLGPHQKKNI